jgi:hypothetical protein
MRCELFVLELGNVLANGRLAERAIAKPHRIAVKAVPVGADSGGGEAGNDFGGDELLDAGGDGWLGMKHHVPFLRLAAWASRERGTGIVINGGHWCMAPTCMPIRPASWRTAWCMAVTYAWSSNVAHLECTARRISSA